MGSSERARRMELGMELGVWSSAYGAGRFGSPLCIELASYARRSQRRDKLSASLL